MRNLFLLRLEIEGICPENALERLKREEIALFEIKKIEKTRIQVCVERKNRKKVFTILQNSCYNILKVENYGFSRFCEGLLSRVGMFVGGVAFALLAMISNLFVLRIDVVGSGNYYQREILLLLAQNGVGVCKTYSPQNVNELTAQILALDRVSFCSIQKRGSVLTVEVQVSGSAPLCQTGNLYSPAKGKVTALVVVRGTARVAVGDEVEEGQLLVGKYQPLVTDEENAQTTTAQATTAQAPDEQDEQGGQEDGEIVMASVTVFSQIQEETPIEGAQAALSAALLKAQTLGGEVVTSEIVPQDDNQTAIVRVEYLVTASINL